MGIGGVVVLRHRDRGGYAAPRCPHCGGELRGWEPPASHWYDTEWGAWLTVILLVGSAGWLVVTGCMWMGGGQTLVEVIREQWRWLMDLLHRIW
jgi:hypothetical protein